jgi:hypothetical protein
LDSFTSIKIAATNRTHRKPGVDYISHFDHTARATMKSPNGQYEVVKHDYGEIRMGSPEFGRIVRHERSGVWRADGVQS